MTDKTTQMDGAKLRPDQIDVLGHVYGKLRDSGYHPQNWNRDMFDLSEELALAFPTLEKWYEDTEEDK